MGQRKILVFGASVAALGLTAFISMRLHAQQPPSQAVEQTQLPSSQTDKPYDWKASFATYKTGKMPRTADGKPDLQGLWSFSILTPLERPGGQHQEQLSSSEAEEAEDTAQQRQINLRVEPTNTPPGEKTTDAYNTFWRDGYFSKVPVTSLRTSQVVDPPDGHVPALTPAAIERQKMYNMKLNRPALGPEDRPTTTRCVRGFSSGPPIIGRGVGQYLDDLQIIQSPSAVIVRQEVVHEDQVIPLNDEARPPENVHQYKGIARGHWEGDVLVVESTNFADDATGVFATHGTTNKMHLIERWKRLDDDHILYGFTMDDPGTWVKSWSAEMVLWRMKDQEQLVEYACHEGNVSLEFALSGARAKEVEEAKEETQEKQQGDR